jgi:Uma2 family endonuclease
MALPKPKLPRMTIEEYLRFEEQSDVKHEYHDGQVIEWGDYDALGMAGASPAHVIIEMNLARIAGNALRGLPCTPYGNNLKIWIERSRKFLYPDLSIICGKIESPVGAASYAASNPKVVFEVLSPGTAAYDRGEKFRLYKAIETLEQYVLIEQSSACVDVYTRGEDGTWRVEDFTGEHTVVTLRSVNLAIPLKELYERIDLLQA